LALRYCSRWHIIEEPGTSSDAKALEAEAFVFIEFSLAQQEQRLLVDATPSMIMTNVHFSFSSSFSSSSSSSSSHINPLLTRLQ